MSFKKSDQLCCCRVVLAKRKSDETNRFVSGKQFAVILSAQLRTYWKYGDLNNIDPTETLRLKFLVEKCMRTTRMRDLTLDY